MRLIDKLLGERKAGALAYRLRPYSGRAWGGPFNGQSGRCRLFAEIITKAAPVAIVETGTYLGTTTDWICAFQIPVWSCEASAHNYGYSSQRLKTTPNANLIYGDSRDALRKILSEPLAEQIEQTIFFYLDAHWNEDLPLAEELEIIFSACPNAVVLVDDFHVPGDDGYGYDDYGPGKALTADYVDKCIKKYDLATFYPSLPSRVETGARRGCAVFARSHALLEELRKASMLSDAKHSMEKK